MWVLFCSQQTVHLMFTWRRTQAHANEVYSQIHSASASNTRQTASTVLAWLSDIDFHCTTIMFTNQIPPSIRQPPLLPPTPCLCDYHSFKIASNHPFHPAPDERKKTNSCSYYIYSICLCVHIGVHVVITVRARVFELKNSDRDRAQSSWVD